MQQTKLPLRNEVDPKLKWKIEDLYQTNDEWQKDFGKLKKLMPNILEYKGKLNTSSDILLKCLKFDNELSQIAEKLYVYANMKLHEDTSNSFYQGLASKSQAITVELSTVTSFIIPEILDIDKNTIKEFFNNKELQIYNHYLNDIMRQKPHILSPEIEDILAQAGDITSSSEDIFSMLNNADIKFGEIQDENGQSIELTKGRFINFLESDNREIRYNAFKTFYKAYLEQKNTLAAIFNANIKKDVFLAKIRKYNSALEYSLDNSNIPIEVYKNLIATVHQNLNLMHRYVDLRKKVLDLDEIHMYDLYAPMVKDIKMEIDFEQTKLKVIDGLQSMGEEYISLLKKGYNDGWIDVVENQNKRSGAYSWGAYGTHPYVLLNYQNNLDNVFTLAHEMGHALHSYYSDENQPYVYAGYKLFVAEVASTVNEALLINYMIKHSTDKPQKMYLINYFLEKFRGTLFRQTMFAEFEMVVHNIVEKGEPLTIDSLCSIYHELNVDYFGNSIIVDSDIDIEWARIPHFYTSFYVYQYATGFSAAIALSQKILNEGEKAVNDYKAFLKSGSSDYPINLLKKAGVDMTTSEPIKKALKVFESLLDEFESLL